MAFFTLKYTPVSGPVVEQSIQQWTGSLDAQLERRNMEVDILSLVCPGSVDAPYQFAYGQPVVLYRDRTFSGGAWGGGSIMFSGKAMMPRRVGSGKEEKIEYRFGGPWWDLQRLVFQQYWYVSASPGSAQANIYCSDVFLGISQALLYLTTARPSPRSSTGPLPAASTSRLEPSTPPPRSPSRTSAIPPAPKSSK